MTHGKHIARTLAISSLLLASLVMANANAATPDVSATLQVDRSELIGNNGQLIAIEAYQTSNEKISIENRTLTNIVAVNAETRGRFEIPGETNMEWDCKKSRSSELATSFAFSAAANTASAVHFLVGCGSIVRLTATF